MAYQRGNRPQSIDETVDMLAAGNYLAGRSLATVLFLALRMKRPLFLEGEAGVGKTEIAKVLAAALDRPLIRLQCYEGLDESKAESAAGSRISACFSGALPDNPAGLARRVTPGRGRGAIHSSCVTFSACSCKRPDGACRVGGAEVATRCAESAGTCSGCLSARDGGAVAKSGAGCRRSGKD